MLDTVVRGEPAPSKRTLGCLLMIAVGAASYARDDANFTVRGYSWACVYLAIIVTEMVYAKHVTATINLSTWSLVLYQNAIALFLWPFASFHEAKPSRPTASGGAGQSWRRQCRAPAAIATKGFERQDRGECHARYDSLG